MATNVVPFNLSQVPAFARNEASEALAKAMAGRAGKTGKRISLENSSFHLVSDGKVIASIDERYLDIVIVAVAPSVSRMYYAGTYQKGVATPPACWSSTGDTPDSSVSDKQSPQCATCPQNEKGSGKAETKACGFNQYFAVVLANDMEGDVMMLKVASRSIFGKEENGLFPSQAYGHALSAQKIGPNTLITRIKFDPDGQSKLFFKPMRWLTPEEYAIVVKQGETEDAKNAVTLTVSQFDGVKGADNGFSEPDAPAPAPKKTAPPALPPEDDEPPAPAPKAKAKPPVEDGEPPVTEPTKRKPNAKDAPAAAGKSKLDELIGEWDDEEA